MKMDIKLANRFPFLEQHMKSFTLFSGEDDLSQEADMAALVRIKRSNMVTSARSVISATSWIFNACWVKSAV